MRKRFTSWCAFGVALVVAFALAPLHVPPAAANDPPDPKIEKNADKAARNAARAAVSAIGSAASAASRQISAIDKAARTGKNVATLSGVASTPGVKVSREQLHGLLDNAVLQVVNFHDTAIAACGGAFGTFAADPALQTLADSTSQERLPGGGGAVDIFTGALGAAWSKGNATVDRPLRKLQGTLAPFGVLSTYTFFPPPPFAAPTTGSPPPAVLGAPGVLATFGNSFGGLSAIVALPGETPVGRIGTDNTKVMLRNTSGAAPFPEVSTYNHLLYVRNLDGSVLSDVGTVFLRDTVSDGTVPCTHVLLVNPGACLTPAETALREPMTNVAGDTVTGFFQSLAAGGKSNNSNLAIAQRPVESIVDLIFTALAVEPAGVPKTRSLDRLRFPCGAGPNGFTVCPAIDSADPGGDTILVGAAFAADIPLNHATHRFQYGFVFDQDGNSANNYVPLPQFQGDYFRGTDKWYAVEYTPANGWTLKVTDARGGGFVQVPSAARAVISGKTIVLSVPASEFSVPDPAYRISSFRHSGDFGQNPPHDWSADYDPAPQAPLRTFRSE